jgi:hypothetical protein
MLIFWLQEENRSDRVSIANRVRSIARVFHYTLLSFRLFLNSYLQPEVNLHFCGCVRDSLPSWWGTEPRASENLHSLCVESETFTPSSKFCYPSKTSPIAASLEFFFT